MTIDQALIEQPLGAVGAHRPALTSGEGLPEEREITLLGPRERPRG